MMEAGRAWWVIQQNCNHIGIRRVRMNRGHWRPGTDVDVTLAWGWEGAELGVWGGSRAQHRRD